MAKEENVNKEALRISLLIVGIFGLIWNIIKLIIAIPTLSYGLTALFTSETPDQGLFVATGIMLATLVVLFIILGFIVFGKCVAYFFNGKRAGKGFIAGVITAAVLGLGIFTASCVTGSIWAQRNGESLYEVYSNLINGVNVDITDCESDTWDSSCSSVKIKDGHIEIKSGLDRYDF